MKTKKGGLDQIWVEDDGSGISKDDLLLAGVRFATSKLKTYDDLKVSPHAKFLLYVSYYFKIYHSTN